MKTVTISGGSGLVGQRLSTLLIEKGYKVQHLSRTPGEKNGVKAFGWNVNEQTIDDNAITTADHIIHLAGAPIIGGRWTDARKKEIIDSRTKSAQLLLDTIKRTGHKPESFVSTSAVGYYGDRGHEILHEDAAPGEGFLTDVCVAWENSVKPATELGIRTVILRVGIVLSSQGGALVEMARPVHFRLGAYLGDGNQYYPWIHIDDLCRMYIKAMEDDKMQGTYNAVGPKAERNKVLTDAIAKAKGISALSIPTPTFVLKAAMGEMSSMILDSARASSDKIEAADFKFEHPDLVKALKDLYRKDI